MLVTTQDAKVHWLLLVFSLPASRASQRVEVWRKLKRCGALALRSSGYVLPHTAANQERLEWLATAIRNYKGQASLVQVQAFDDLPEEKLKQLFVEARTSDYESVLRELKKFLARSPARRSATQLSRLRRRFQEIVAIDFFSSPLRSRVETSFSRAEETDQTKSGRQAKASAGEYRNRQWITRPRPGIDRVSCAWLIRRFIDPRARFLFGNDPAADPQAVAFDMFVPQGFGHRGEDCSFETLCKHFALRDSKVKRIAQIVHDADLNDEKFGRVEGQGLDQVLNGWAQQGIADDELLERGISLIEGLYHSLA
jgi:hypothetical protein